MVMRDSVVRSARMGASAASGAEEPKKMPNQNKKKPSRAIALMFAVGLAFIPSLATAQAVESTYPIWPTGEPASATVTSRMVTLTADFVIMLHVPREIGAVFLGNSSMADATWTDGRMIILRGVSQGVTNMIVLDEEGFELAEYIVQVSDRKPGMITVRRAIDLQSYFCPGGFCESDGSPNAMQETGTTAIPGAN
ncbi:MAG: Flp pilus assembly secretin CpaC [Paracoccaceae bacterium]|jgi:Flp pilus assembly secretin CpaC